MKRQRSSSLPSILATSPSWKALPDQSGDGRWRLPDARSRMWPEYGRLLPLCNLLAAQGHSVEEQPGPLTDEHGELAIGRWIIVRGVDTRASELPSWLLLPANVHAADVGDERVGFDRAWGTELKDGWISDHLPYDVAVTLLPPESNRKSRKGTWAVPLPYIPLESALERARPLVRGTDSRLALPQDPPLSGSWGRLLDIAAHLRSVGFGVTEARLRDLALSPIVVLGAAVLVTGVPDPSGFLETIRFPPGMEWERLDTGGAILRDFGPNGFEPMAPNWAIIFDTSGSD